METYHSLCMTAPTNRFETDSKTLDARSTGQRAPKSTGAYSVPAAYKIMVDAGVPHDVIFHIMGSQTLRESFADDARAVRQTSETRDAYDAIRARARQIARYHDN
jgi:hypothetical protein